MKIKIAIIGFMCFSLFASRSLGQESIKVTMHSFYAYNKSLKTQQEKDGIEAFKIMSSLFSSMEFQDSVKNLTFPSATFCSFCGREQQKVKKPFPTNVC
jgi:hypothetical protein